MVQLSYLFGSNLVYTVYFTIVVVRSEVELHQVLCMPV